MLGRTFGMLQRQVGVLMYKNLVILARNWLSTTVRLLSCAFFMVLMWIIISAMNGARGMRTRHARHPGLSAPLASPAAIRDLARVQRYVPPVLIVGS